MEEQHRSASPSSSTSLGTVTQQRLQHLLAPVWMWRMFIGGGTLLSVRVSSVLLVLTDDKSFEVTMVRGEDFSDKIFQNPGGYFPLRVREPQLWALCRDLGGADLGLPLEVVGFLSRGLS